MIKYFNARLSILYFTLPTTMYQYFDLNDILNALTLIPPPHTQMLLPRPLLPKTLSGAGLTAYWNNIRFSV
jgi:hypothetical protein